MDQSFQVTIKSLDKVLLAEIAQIAARPAGDNLVVQQQLATLARAIVHTAECYESLSGAFGRLVSNVAFTAKR